MPATTRRGLLPCRTEDRPSPDRQALPVLRRDREARTVVAVDVTRWRRWLRYRRRWLPIPCADCGIDVVPLNPLGARDWQRFMVTDATWAAAGMEPLGGWLCVDCLESRLGRPLTGADFQPVPLNDPDVDDETPRLAELKRAAAEHHARST